MIEMGLLFFFFWTIYLFLYMCGVQSPDIWILTIVIYCEFFAMMRLPGPFFWFLATIATLVIYAVVYM